MKKILFALLLVSCVAVQAGNIRTIRVEPKGETYVLSIWGRLEGGIQEDVEIKDLDEIAKIEGIQNQAEFAIPVKPQRFWIHFADGTDPDKVVGSIDSIDFHFIETKEFVQSLIAPTGVQSKQDISDLKTLVESKPVDDGK